MTNVTYTPELLVAALAKNVYPALTGGVETHVFGLHPGHIAHMDVATDQQ